MSEPSQTGRREQVACGSGDPAVPSSAERFQMKEAAVQLKASTDYGLRAVLYLAHKGGTCSSKEISEEMLIPRDYLIQLAQLLRRAGIVDARPGKNGGYRLAKDPADITLLAVMHAVGEDSKSAVRAEREERLVSAHLDERVRRAYDRALESYDAFMGGITIASLLEG